MTTYLRVRVRPESGAPFTVILCDPTETKHLLIGTEVDREGDEVVPRGADTRVRVIETSLIVKRTPLVMDKHTATLVEPGQTMEETEAPTTSA